tara:strand:- start:4122 stop:4505 length:384 start_codon:yes stop_codon:yes gene_type:complete
MTKTIEQIQEENREFIIMALHPDAKTYDEACCLEFGCSSKFAKSRSNFMVREKYEAIPLTLNRVLIALAYADIQDNLKTHVDYKDRYLLYTTYHNYLYFGDSPWDLTKKTLEEQSEETQRTINKLIR